MEMCWPLSILVLLLMAVDEVAVLRHVNLLLGCLVATTANRSEFTCVTKVLSSASGWVTTIAFTAILSLQVELMLPVL